MTEDDCVASNGFEEKQGNKRSRWRVFWWIVGITLVGCLALMLICDYIVVANARGKVFSNVNEIDSTDVGLLLGTPPNTRIGNRKNLFFVYRIDAAEQLYKAGKIKRILISGDEHSLDGVDETQCMRDTLVAHGVPDSVIILDGKGFRTILSVINANKKFGFRQFTVISQRFHNERSIYQAEHLGLDVENIQALNAKDPQSKMSMLIYVREYFARVKMFMDLFMKDYTDFYEPSAEEKDSTELV